MAQVAVRPDVAINEVGRPVADVTVIVLLMSEDAQYSDDSDMAGNVMLLDGSSTR